LKKHWGVDKGFLSAIISLNNEKGREIGDILDKNLDKNSDKT